MGARVVLAVVVATAMAQAFADALDDATLVLYADDTAAPNAAEDAIDPDAVELVRFQLPSANAATNVDGLVTVAALPPENWLYSGRVGWARLEDATGAGIMLPNVGTVDEALVLSSLDAVAGEPVTVVAWTFVVPTLVEG